MLNQGREPFLITVENAGTTPVKIVKDLTVNYEDDDHERSNIYFITYYWDKRFGLTAFNHHVADIDYWEDPVRPSITTRVSLKPYNKLSLKCNPFDYSGIIQGEKKYRIVCAFRIRQKCGDIVYKSNYLDFTFK